METKGLKNAVLLGAILLCIGSVGAVAASLPSGGTLNVTILDETGALAFNAPVYIYGESDAKFMAGKEIAGTATLNMPAGIYRVSSAVMRKTGNYYDRYASREAHVRVIAGDNTMVTLQLYSLDNTRVALDEHKVKVRESDGYKIARTF